ncbi:MAG: hypothetical protein HY427_00060 [Candidatus Levybacteria bacterium]|nr:hypothetical protein [Candidatus Levybacteria bacterium]
MFTSIYKKITNIFDRATDFVRKNTVQVVIIVSCFAVLELIQSFPYVNIIPRYQFLVISFVLLLSVVLLRVFISSKLINYVVLALFVISIFTAILDIEQISNLIGFVAFVLLSIMVIRQIFQDREKLKEVGLEKESHI